MGPEVIVPVSGMLMILGIVLGIPLVRSYTKRVESKPMRDSLPSGEVITRLDRIEQSIEAMATEVERIAACVGDLSVAVKNYRDFLERVRTLTRGRLRMARYAMVEHDFQEGAHDPKSLEKAISLLARFEAEAANEIEPQRRLLKGALEREIMHLRSELDVTDERLVKGLSARFATSIYPELAADRTCVTDEVGDDDDDAAS